MARGCRVASFGQGEQLEDVHARTFGEPSSFGTVGPCSAATATGTADDRFDPSRRLPVSGSVTRHDIALPVHSLGSVDGRQNSNVRH